MRIFWATTLLDYLCRDARADGAAALGDGEAHLFFDGDRGDQLDLHGDVVAGHHHLGTLRQLDLTGHVGGPHVELRAVALEERGVAATLFLGQDVDLRVELGVRLDRSRLGQDLAALDLLALDPAKQAADVVARLAGIEQLVEHLDTGHDRLAGVVDADHLDLFVDLDLAALDAAGDDRATTFDREHVLDRHHERLVEGALRHGDVAVDRIHQLRDRVFPLGVALERLERRHLDDRNVFARELVLRQQLADLELDELQDLGIVDRIDLVEGNDDPRYADLARQQDVLASLRHRPVSRGHNQDGIVHLSGAGDHVLAVVGVPGAVDVGVVALRRLVLDVRGRERDAASLLFGGIVDRIEGAEFSESLLCQNLRDGRGQRGLAMVDMTDGSHVDVRLGALVLLLRHCYSFSESSLSSRLRNDLFRDRLRDFLIVMKLHAVDGAALRLGPQVGRVTEHVAQRHVGAHHLHRRPAFHPEDLTAPRREVAEDLAHELLGHDDLDLHDRLEQRRLALLHAVLGRHRAGDGERHLVGVDLVVRTVHQGGLDVDDRIAGQHAAVESLDDALLDRRVVFLRDRAAHDLVDELEALAGLVRLDVDLGVTVLAAPTRLPDEPPDAVRLALDRLAVGDLRLAHVGVDRKLPQHPVDDDLEVQLAHPGDDGLGGVLVGPDLERRVFLGELGERLAHLLLVHLGARLDRHADDRVLEHDRLQQDRIVLVGEGVPRRRLLQADRRRDVAGVDLGDLLPVVGVHLEDAPDPLLGTAGRIPDIGAGLERAGVDPEERQLADVGVGRDLEREPGEGLVVGGLPPLGHVALGVDPFHTQLVQRRGQEVDDGVQHRLHPAVAERGARQHRDEPVRDRALADGGDDLGAGDRLVVQVLLQQDVVELGDRLDQLLVVQLDLFPHLDRDLLGLDRGAQVVGIGDRNLINKVDDALELLLAADRELDRDGVRPQPLADRLPGREEVGAHPVHLVDEGDPGHLVAIGLPPDRLGLGLDPGDGVENGHRAVQDAQAPLDLDRKVYVPGCVDDVDPVAAPVGDGGRRGDRDPPLLLLDHPVHGGGAVVHLSHLVDSAGIEEDALGRGRLPGIDVGHDADVPNLVQRVCASHFCCFCHFPST